MGLIKTKLNLKKDNKLLFKLKQKILLNTILLKILKNNNDRNLKGR